MKYLFMYRMKKLIYKYKKKEEEETIKKVIYKNIENYFYILVSDMKDYNQLFNNSFKWIYVLFIHI